VAAHRGGALLWPENSLTAFRNALGLRVDALEFDLHGTADGEIVVLHDPVLDRTTTGRGPVGTLALADVRRHRLRGPDGAPTDDVVPTFAEVLDAAAPSSVAVVPEIKLGPDRRRYDGIEDGVLGLLRARGLLARATVQSFDRPTLRRLRELDRTVGTMLLVPLAFAQHRGATGIELVRWATEVEATDLGIDHRLLGHDVALAARRAGVRLAVWTVNEEPDLRRAIDLGAEVLITDRPDLALRLLAR
jgi:glycerophosphoryl diester phosphodiesterase